jgi:hypothetical protein
MVARQGSGVPGPGNVVWLLVISAQRRALLDGRDDGIFGVDVPDAVAAPDEDQMGLELRGAPASHGQPATRPNIMKYVIVQNS